MSQLKGFQFVTTLFLLFKNMENEDKTKYVILFKLKSRNSCQLKFHQLCVSINLHYNYIKHTKNLGKRSGWIIDSVIDHNIS